jgi:hypothetical protein
MAEIVVTFLNDAEKPVNGDFVVGKEHNANFGVSENFWRNTSYRNLFAGACLGGVATFGGLTMGSTIFRRAVTFAQTNSTIARVVPTPEQMLGQVAHQRLSNFSNSVAGQNVLVGGKVLFSATNAVAGAVLMVEDSV